MLSRQRSLATVAVVLLAALGAGVPLALSSGHDTTPSSSSRNPVGSRPGTSTQDSPNGSSKVAAGGSAASEGGPSRRGSGVRETPPGETLRSGSGRAPLAALVAPDAHVQVGRGRVVAGFPRGLEVVAGSRVTSSSVSPSGRRAQVALTATAPEAPAWVVAHFRATLRALGLRDDVVDALPGSRAVRFSSGSEVLVLTVRARGAGSAYSLVGVVPTRGSRP